MLVSLDGEPLGDPLSLPQRVQAWYGKEMEVVVRRRGPSEKDRQEQTLRVTPEPPDSYENVFTVGSPMSVRSLGIVVPRLAPRRRRSARQSRPSAPECDRGTRSSAWPSCRRTPNENRGNCINEGGPIDVERAHVHLAVHLRSHAVARARHADGSELPA